MLGGTLTVLAAACASTSLPPMTTANPANSKAPEGTRLPRQESLQPDSASRKTAALLSAAQKKSEHADAGSSASDASIQSPK
jgi:hypothetical protein